MSRWLHFKLLIRLGFVYLNWSVCSLLFHVCLLWERAEMARGACKKLVSWRRWKSQEGKRKHTIPISLNLELAHSHSYLHSIDKSESQILAPWDGEIQPAHILLPGTAKPCGKGEGIWNSNAGGQKGWQTTDRPWVLFNTALFKACYFSGSSKWYSRHSKHAHKPNTGYPFPHFYAMQAKKGFLNL